MVQKLRTGSAYKERIAKWEAAYQDVERYLPNSVTWMPLADPRYGKLDAPTFVSRSKHTDGLASAVWTPNRTIEAIAPTYEGPGEIPVLALNGTTDEFESPDAAYWSTAGAFSLAVWIRWGAAGGATDYVWSKWDDTTSAEQQEYSLRTDGSRKMGMLIRDQSTTSNIGREISTAAPRGQWLSYVATFDGGTDAAGIKVYLNGVQADDATIVDAAGFVDAEDKTAVMAFGRFLNASTAKVHYLIGDVAGGPLSPFFCKTELTAEQVAAIYRTQAAALGVL